LQPLKPGVRKIRTPRRIKRGKTMTSHVNHGPTVASAASITLAGGALGFNWLPVYVAERQGIFARHGLNVIMKRMGSVDKATAAVRSGEADLAITPPEGAIADATAGGRLRIIAGNVNRLPLSLVANPRFKRIEDLRGCTLGTSSMTEATAIYTRELLARHGLAYPGDYEFSVVGVHPAPWQALQEGRIDAAVQLIPLNFIAFDAGYSNLGEVSDYIPEIVFTAMIGGAAWIAEHRREVEDLHDSLVEATDRLYDISNDSELLPVLMEIAQSDAMYAQKALDYMREKEVFSRGLEIPAAAIDKTVELMLKAGLLDPAAKDRVGEALDTNFMDRLAGSRA